MATEDLEQMLKKLDYIRANCKKFKQALIKIAPSEQFGGIGVFAVRNLAIGTKIGEVDYMDEGFFLAYADFKKIDKESQKIITDFCANSKEGFFIPKDINYMSIPWHMNHCCDGNVGFDAGGNFVTIKKVKKGDELCYDYGFGMSNPKYKLVCRCKSSDCRKIITGNDWKNPEYVKKNYKYMSPEIKYLIKHK
jgi:hypothetical protein